MVKNAQTVAHHEIHINKDFDETLLSLLATSILKVKNIEDPAKVKVITPLKTYQYTQNK